MSDYPVLYERCQKLEANLIKQAEVNCQLFNDNARLRAVLAKIASPMDCDKVNGKCRSMRLAQEAIDREAT